MNIEKFKSIIHYIIYSVPFIDLSKLNAILWHSDRESYLKEGKTITGETYIKTEQGIVSKHLIETIIELEQEKKIKILKE